ncbi:MAG: DUF2288 domain-containing protein [Synechocystis sp.]|jgi:hypothetical protein|nr:DUF2288 domain-containing protein [Synechocystis sp.]
MSDIQKQLVEELAPMDWGTIMPHAKRDAVIVVDPSLDLVTVATAIATDQVSQVNHWISELLIHKPNEAELTTWNEQPAQEFQTLIVQPYVLIQAG